MNIKLRLYISWVIMWCATYSVIGSNFTIRGKVTDKEQTTAIEPAVVTIPGCQLWAVTNEKGEFIIKGVPAGSHMIVISCLGYCKREMNFFVDTNIDSLNISLQPDNLALSEVIVTARENKQNTATSYLIDRTALEHHQMSSINSLSSLLPGGKSINDNNLTKSDKRLEIRAETGETGNPSFMTGVEIDGIRLTNNASFTETAGIDLRNITTSNIESVEVITGIPSAEYGDVSGGIVKINTRKGRSPLEAMANAGPLTKSLSLSGGFDMGKNHGILNMSLERTTSVAEPASPHTRYSRNGLNLTYSNTLARNTGSPLSLTATFAGNIGGLNSESDPDAFAETYTKRKDHTFRGAVNMDWLLNKPFLTGIEGKLSIRYSDKQQKINTNKSSSTAVPVFHGKEEGYFVATAFDEDPDASVSLIPAGYWYQLQYHDDRPIDYNASLKLYHNLNRGEWSNKIKLGADFSATGNKGIGTYYDDPRLTPDWRAYPYYKIPYMYNIAFFAEDRTEFPIGNTRMQLTAGLRYENTRVDGSGYGTTGAFSPRISMVYTLFNRPESKLLRSVKLRGGFGEAVKLPSFNILYPAPTYRELLTFAPGAQTDGTAYYAYYIMPSEQFANPSLKWQATRQTEIGADIRLGQVNIILNAYRNRTRNGYMSAIAYTPFSYKFTNQKSMEGIPVPTDDRIYSVDRLSGVVTVTDRSGTHSPIQLPYTERTTFKGETYATNSSPVLREGIEWVADFGKVPALFTSFRLDGSFYHYKSVNETLTAALPASSQTMADGSPYKYVGYYAGFIPGTKGVANGSETHRLNTNLTITTHIPHVRLLVSLRIESTLYHASRNLSQYDGKPRGIVLNDKGDYTGIPGDIYGGDRYIAVYPEYYVSAEDINTKTPFEEKFLWTKEHDPALYNELAKLVYKTNTSYYFNKNRISPYFSANLNVTKEIGKHFTVSFFASNFLNNLSKIKSSWNDTETTLFNSSRIPVFDYGISLKVKL